MIEIRANEAEAEVSGTVEELLEVALTVRALVGSSQDRVVIQAVSCNVAPYQNTLASLAVSRRPGLTLVEVSQQSLEISGSDASLEAFSSWFEFPTGSRPGLHNHFEPLPDDSHHSWQSASLVVMVSGAGA